MMPRLAACVLLLILPSAVHAQEPALLEIAMLTCVAPGTIPAGDPYQLIASLPEKNCVRACKAEARGCRNVVKSIDRCGVSFLKAAAKTAIEICRGLGGTSRECREIKDIVKPDIDWWRAAGKQERADCAADMQTLCLSRCQSAVSIYNSIPPPQGRPTAVPQGEGVTLVALPGVRMTMPLVPEIPEGGVREGAIDAITYLESQSRALYETLEAHP
jgi:hypothetical protein